MMSGYKDISKEVYEAEDKLRDLFDKAISNSYVPLPTPSLSPRKTFIPKLAYALLILMLLSLPLISSYFKNNPGLNPNPQVTLVYTEGSVEQLLEEPYEYIDLSGATPEEVELVEAFYSFDDVLSY